MLSAITYSDMDVFLTSRRQSARHLRIGTFLRAALVFGVVEITGLLFSERHARHTVRYGASVSRYTESHCSARG